MQQVLLKEVQKNKDTMSLITCLTKHIHCKLIPKNDDINDNIDDNINNINNIYQDDNNMVMLTEKCNLVNRIIAIKDYKYDNKFLILFNIYGYYMNMYVYGFFVFFDEHGHVAQKKHINDMIVSYDHRDVNMSHDNMFLYDDHFLFIYDHRDTKKLIGNFVLFNTSQNCEYVEMKNYNHYFSFGGTIVITNNSNVVIKNKKDDKNKMDVKYKVIDLYFDDHFTISEWDDYTKAPLTKKECIDLDGYPLLCGKCGEKSVNATASYNNCVIGFGNCFCSKCLIRYSKSDQRWYCCQSINKKPCQNMLNNDYCCDLTHGDNPIINLTKTYIPPYIMKGSVIYK